MASTLELLNAARLAFHDNKPTAYLTQTVAQSIPNNTVTPVTFNNAADDNWTGWSSGANSRYTVQVAGVYAISGLIPFAINPTGSRISLALYNGSVIGNAVPGSQYEIDASTSGLYVAVTPPILQLAAVGDYFQLGAYQSSGGALSTTSVPSMTVHWLRNP